MTDAIHDWLDELARDWPPNRLSGRLGAPSVPLFADRAILDEGHAPGLARLARAFRPQQTGSACSLASLTLAYNALAGADLTQDAMLDLVNDAVWREVTAEGGRGVTFNEIAGHAARAFAATGPRVQAANPAREHLDDADFRRALAALSEHSAMLLYFNQGVLTGDWDGPHLSLIAGHHPVSDTVLILDVDRELPLPYLSPLSAVMAAMTKPVRADHGRLAGETGGWILIQPR